MMNKKLLLFAFIFFETLYYSQNLIENFQDKIDFNLLNELVKMSDDSIYVSNLNLTKQSFYFYDSKNNNKIFSNEYEIAYPFVGESAIVKFNGNWGLINRLGKFIYYSETNNTVKLSPYERYGIFYNGVQEIFNLRNGEKQSGFIYCAEPAGPDFFVVKTKSNKFQLIKVKDKKSVFKEEMDSIILRNHLIYDSQNNLIIVNKKNKYGLYLSDGDEIFKIKYEKIKFLGNYIMLLENRKWNYYTFENNRLNLIVSTDIECITSAYQKNIIGVFMRDKKYNFLKTDGKSLFKEFDYISPEATYGINENSVVIFNSKGGFYDFYNK